MTVKKERIFVGMSGGVDSSVTAALLLRAGYDVTGVFIKVWQADFLPCTWREERRDAMRAAAVLGIPFLTLDLEREYKEEVVDYMIREYGAGRVPNPDVMCNKHVKFGAFLEFALKHGADLVATGHYAQIRPSTRSTIGDPELLAGADAGKDQSYFLWTMTKWQLEHAMFPVGHMKKTHVRALAKKYGLPNAEKKDSQGLCFMGKIDMRDFLKHYLKTSPGDVHDESGKVIGTHEGAMLYVIGQRHGFHTFTQDSIRQPLFVVRKDVKKNIIVVSSYGHKDESQNTRSVTLEKVNDISGTLFTSAGISGVIRYHGARVPVSIGPAGERVAVEFKDPVSDISPGQSLVFYSSDVCLGGGIIT